MLGWAAFAPLVAGGLGVWIAPRGFLLVVALLLMDAWAGGLVCFFAGVRRGLTFSERRGASVREAASFLGLFLVGFGGLALAQPLLLALGFLLAGGLDLAAARKREAPAYFARLRPAQAIVGALAMVSLAARLAERLA